MRIEKKHIIHSDLRYTK